MMGILPNAKGFHCDVKAQGLRILTCLSTEVTDLKQIHWIIDQSVTNCVPQSIFCLFKHFIWHNTRDLLYVNLSVLYLTCKTLWIL